MANATEKQILSDGQRNVVVKLVGTVDTADVSIAPAIRLSDLSTDPTQTLVGLKIEKIEFSIGKDLEVSLTWQSSNPQQIAALADTGCIKFSPLSAPDRTRSDYNGDINLATTGFQLGRPTGYTIVLYMVKKYIP